MAAKWVDQGWVSVRDLAHLGWSSRSISKLKKAVPEVDSGISELGRARDLSEVNGWARDNGEPEISAKALGGSKVRSSSESVRRRERGTHPNSKLNGKPARQKRNRQPPSNQAVRNAQAVQAQLDGKWFDSKQDANRAGFLSAKDLEDRFWTESIMGKLLPNPDGFGQNHFGSMPVRYWSVELVMDAESRGEFISAMASSLKRRKISWEQGVSSIGSSNRELQLPFERSELNWSVILGERL